jgi:F-type H+-transporting ATPase subunit epsilon
MVMNIRVLTPDRVICSTTADEVILPGLTGQIGILDGHAALITALDTGLLRIKALKKWTPIVLCGGLAEVEENQITILVNEIEEIPLIELSEANKRVELAMASYDEAETAKSRYETYLNLKKALAVLEGINYLS